jgi:hypothetical protein
MMRGSHEQPADQIHAILFRGGVHQASAQVIREYTCYGRRTLQQRSARRDGAQHFEFHFLTPC